MVVSTAVVGCENVARASLPGTNFPGDVKTNANVDAVVIPLLVFKIRRSVSYFLPS